MTDIFAPKAAYAAWRVNPAQDRKPSPVVTRPATPEELAKYSDTGTYKKPFTLGNFADGNKNANKIKEDKDMKGPVPKISYQQLLEECKLRGTGTAAQRKIGLKYGLSDKTIENKIYKGGVYAELKSLQASTSPVEDKKAYYGNGVPEMLPRGSSEQLDGKTIGINTKEDIHEFVTRMNKNVEVYEKNKQDIEDMIHDKPPEVTHETSRKYEPCAIDSNYSTMQTTQIELEQLKAQNAAYWGALDEIADPIKYMRKEADERGCNLDGGMAVALSGSASYLKSIAEKALSSEIPNYHNPADVAALRSAREALQEVASFIDDVIYETICEKAIYAIDKVIDGDADV